MRRFWDKAKKVGDCLEWQGALSGGGYGHYHFEGRAQAAHRVAFQLTRGPIPEGMVVRHTCDNPACVNPDHLALGTHRDNVNDAIDRKRYLRNCFRGSDSYNATLSDGAVRYIKSSYSGACGEQTKLAKMFGVRESTIHAIVHNKTWQHIAKNPSLQPLTVMRDASWYSHHKH